MKKDFPRKLKIAFVTPEALPFVKTGGLADVSHALPVALANAGHDVRIFMPRYYRVDKEKYRCREVYTPLGVPIGFTEKWASVYSSYAIPEVTTYFIEHDNYYGRDKLYDDGYNAYSDNAERFTFFCRGVMQAMMALDFTPDIIHCNDWQTGLIPIYLKTFYKDAKNFKNARSVMTIHNIGYQGVFCKDDIVWSQLGWDAFSEDTLKFYEAINFLKGGIGWADAITTVSERYAKEIQTFEFGYDLAGLLHRRKESLFGITNGVDYNSWHPETDPNIPAHFSHANTKGKLVCKEALQHELGLPVKPDTPLMGTITRITHQKGIDILASALERILPHSDVQFALLGSGDQHIISRIMHLKSLFPDKIAYHGGYNDPLAHRIEAGCDIYLMPSRYEPCGLNQMYSMKYGTIPVVHATGGLDDTVTEWNDEKKSGTGFKFSRLNPSTLAETIESALSLYSRKNEWKLIVKNAMSFEREWDKAVADYEKIYYSLIK